MRATIDDAAHGLTTPQAWPWARNSPPLVSSEQTRWHGALVRRWQGTSSVMTQPPLDHHYVVIHLGGAKRVKRRRDAPEVSTVAENASLTLVPAGTSFVWNTEGPIDFAHLYVHPRQLGDALEREADLDGRSATLVDRVGHPEPFLAPLFLRMLDALASRHPPTLLLDALLERFLVRLTQQHVDRRVAAPRTVALAPYRLRRVLDLIDAEFARDLSLADLVRAAGTSQSHFVRSFHLATGHPPYRYLLLRRIEYARVRLLTGSSPIDDVASACGFNSRHQFAEIFRQVVGVSPKAFQRCIVNADVVQKAPSLGRR